jgi:GNAT superfamily N-acetyltransferase
MRGLDPHDEVDMDAFQAVYAVAELAEDPDAHLYSRADGISILTSKDGGFTADAFGAFVDGRMVGESMVHRSLHDNLDLATLWVWVDPDHQRRGVGTRVLTHAEAYARSHGRTLSHLRGRIGPDRDNGNRRFAEKLGYDLANTEIERRLTLPAGAGLLTRLEAEAAPHHRDYEIRTVVGPVPEELAPSYVALSNLLVVEAPTGDLEVEAHQHTVVEVAAQDRRLSESGRTRVASYALDREGTVVGYAEAATTEAGFDHVDQWGTLVHPAHRGHRLGMAVKCAQVRAVAEHFPDKHFLSTTNAETNAHMVGINEALGFVIHQAYGEFQRRL